jgi:hypothetical protein
VILQCPLCKMKVDTSEFVPVPSAASPEVGLDSYRCAPLKSRQIQFGLVVLILLYAFSLGIVIRAMPHVSVYVIAWIAISMVSVGVLFRSLLRRYQAHQRLLFLRSIDTTDTVSPASQAIAINDVFTSMVVLCCFWSIFPLLMALTLLLSR